MADREVTSSGRGSTSEWIFTTLTLDSPTVHNWDDPHRQRGPTFTTQATGALGALHGQSPGWAPQTSGHPRDVAGPRVSQKARGLIAATRATRATDNRKWKLRKVAHPRSAG